MMLVSDEVQRLLKRTQARVFLGSILLVCIFLATRADAMEYEFADRLLLKKSERKLFLMKNDQILRSFDVALGLLPEGHKSKEGDFKTPEGIYKLAERNPASDFFLSILISYPNQDDARRARLQGVSPGGQIMIHGQPNNRSHSVEYYRMTDWTNGCIAVSNSDMVDIWLMTRSNTLIQILP